MNQQGTMEGTATSEQTLRDWEDSEWFREWLDRHEQDTAVEVPGESEITAQQS
jgi:hypothetical protein